MHRSHKSQQETASVKELVCIFKFLLITIKTQYAPLSLTWIEGSQSIAYSSVDRWRGLRNGDILNETFQRNVTGNTSQLEGVETRYLSPHGVIIMNAGRNCSETSTNLVPLTKELGREGSMQGKWASEASLLN